MAVGYMSLGIVQILETLSGFCNPSMGSVLVLDPRFKFLHILEEHHDPSVSLLALQALQTRTTIAIKRMNTYLHYLQSERAVFSQDLRDKDLGKLLARPQYKLAIQDPNKVGDRLFKPMLKKGYVPRSSYYKPSRFSFHVPSEQPPSISSVLPSQSQSAPRNLHDRKENEQVPLPNNLGIPMPESLSAILPN
ncbi:hypothetical protein K435DRAFT_873615 [Dendrothele bispora CBS 962.96]|uniref:Uncharacterized protein n=1 Tax=Dendrothele bispora (strain CBS 962.96) TaxID=1314807 RepID=A0A4S8KYP3_DENBC|nr:hypothetical protein K435DRAFT_873615 [Dendrothele bispora CBS 962.96]